MTKSLKHLDSQQQCIWGMQALGIPWKAAPVPEMAPEWLWQCPRAAPEALPLPTPTPSCWPAAPGHTERSQPTPGAPAFVQAAPSRLTAWRTPARLHRDVSFPPVHTLSWTVLLCPAPGTDQAREPAALAQGREQRLLFPPPPGARQGSAGPSPDAQQLGSFLTFVGGLGEESRSQKRRHLAKSMGAGTESRSF